MLLALDAPASEINFHHFIRIQRLRRNAHPSKQEALTLRFFWQPAADMTENIVKLSVQNTSAEEDIISELL